MTNGKARKLLVMGIAASFGAPIVSVVCALIISVSAGRVPDFSVLGVMALTALLFSFICTELLVLVTIAIGRIVRPRKLGILSISLFYLVVLVMIVAIVYGTPQAMVFFGLAIPNALIIIAIGKMRFEKGQFTT